MDGFSSLWESVSSAAGGLAASLRDADMETLRSASGASDGPPAEQGQRASAAAEQGQRAPAGGQAGEDREENESRQEESAEDLSKKLCRRAHRGDCCKVHAPEPGAR